MLLGGISALSLVAAILFSFGEPWWGYLAAFCRVWLGLFVLALVFLVIVCAFVDTKKEQTHDSKFYRSIMYLYIDALISLVGLRVRTQGLEQTPKEGRFLLVCNHLCVADPGIILSYFKKSQLAFISKRENMTLPIVNKFMHKTMCQYVNRENDREALKTIIRCIQLIREDETSVCVFPEGYIHLDYKLHHFRSGVFKIAQKTEVPIVVCTIRGTHKIFHNLKHLKPTPVELHLVGVIPAEEVRGANTVALGERVYEMMAADLGPDLVAQEG